MKQYLPLHDTPKFTQIVIFGLKICHLAALVASRQNQGHNAVTFGDLPFH
jgi:hypothetical protein